MGLSFPRQNKFSSDADAALATMVCKPTAQAQTTQKNRFTYLYSTLESSQLNGVGHFPS